MATTPPANSKRDERPEGEPGPPASPDGARQQRTLQLKRLLSYGFAALTIVLVAAVGYVSLILVSPTRVEVGPLTVDFSLRPSWHGKSVVNLPPAGSIEADTHAGPAAADFTLQEISVENISDLTNPDSPSRQALDNWRDPVDAATRWLLLRIVIAAALSGGIAGAVIRRRWQWGVAGAGVALVVALAVAGTAYATFSASAFNEPRYDGGLTYAPDVVAFSEQTLANLNSYENRVPEIAASLYRTVNELHGLPAEIQPEDNTIRVLHVSDMHSSTAGANLLNKVAGLYKTDFVIDTGDMTDLGTPFEMDYPRSYLPLAIPYVWVAGNHDTPTVTNTMKSIAGVTVLQDEYTAVDGVTIAGFPDPAAKSLLPDPSSDETQKQEAARIASMIRAQNRNPFIVAVHDPKQAAQLAGLVPVVVEGHTHHENVSIDDGTVFLDAGTTGGGGLRSFDNGGESPSSLQVLYIRRDSLKLEAVDSISIYGYSQQFSVSRRVFADNEGAQGIQSASAAPVGATTN